MDRIPTDALEDACRKLYTRLYRYWLSKGCIEDAEDLAQLGVLSGLDKLGRWQGRDGASPLTFMTTVGRNAGIDQLRKEGRYNKFKARAESILVQAGLITTGSKDRSE